MEKIEEGFLSKIGEYLAEATIRQGRYLCCFKNIVEDLKEEESNLKSAERHMKEEVERARNNTMIINEDVEKWLNDARNIQAEVQRLNEEIQVKKSCLNGWCPNWGCRYWLGRKAAKKSIIVKGVVQKAKFENVGHLVPLPGIEFSMPRDFGIFQSSKSVFEEIIEALKDDNENNLVGLYGMGGTGKTTLAKAVGNKVEEDKIFDVVIMVVITQNPNFKDIQGQLAESLKLKLAEDSEENRAKRLHARLTGTKDKILLILDDVWKTFDLKSKLGIPFDSDNVGCKVLLTTRVEQVCIDMNCQQRSRLNVLEEEEGLALLKRHACIVDDSSELTKVAVQVARECGGLPLALVAIGGALKEKGINEWKVMSQKLRKSKLEDVPNCNVAGEKGIYSILKLSYDNLMGEKTKSCFLLCSLFPEDHPIDSEELLTYAMGLGLFRDADSVEDARIELLLMVSYLKASGLLLETWRLSSMDAGKEYVKMHDLVRDVAFWIASKGENVFMSKVGMGQIEWSREEDWERFTAISSMANKIEKLWISLVCPKLEILILGGQSSEKILEVSDECFKEMKALKVLSLRFVHLSLKSLQFLTNLKTLRLSYCNIGDISYLEKLDRLEILWLEKLDRLEIFWFFPFEELSREISELRNLRLLYLEESGIIPSNALRRCSKLEELYALYGFGTEKSDASLFELTSLSRLSTLYLCIYTTCLPKDLAFPRLQRYVICVNTNFFGRVSYRRALKISNIEATSLIAFKALYETLEYLCLQNATGCKNILPSIDQGGLNELKEAEISHCEMLEEVFQLEGLCHAGREVIGRRLAKLELENLPQLRHIWNGPMIHHVNLQSLTYLSVHQCERLEHIFPISIVRDLVGLEELRIRNAPQLRQVFYMDHAREESISEIDEEEIVLPKLRILRLERLEMLTGFLPKYYHPTCPMLENLLITECPSLTTSFISMRDQKKLQKLAIEDCEELEQIIFEDNEEDHPQSLFFPSLSQINVRRCGKLKHLLPITTAQGLQQLESIEVEGCARLEKVFGRKDGVGVMNDFKEIILPQLKRLSLVELPSLTNVGPVGYRFMLKLNSLRVDRCCKMVPHDRFCEEGLVSVFGLQREMRSVEEEERLCKGPTNILSPKNLFKLCIIKPYCSLKHIFSSNVARDLLQLREFYIFNCEELEQIIMIEDDEEDHIKIPFFPNLIKIDVGGCNKLKHLFPITIAAGLQKLQSIYVQGCDQLQKLFGHKNGPDEMNLFFPNLKEIDVRRCNKLKHLFPITIATGLQQLQSIHVEGNVGPASYHFPTLQELSIKNCKELEQIIVEDSREDHPQSLFFPSLRKIDVDSCGKLKHLFPVTLAQGLQLLKSITVERCAQLEKVFGHKDGVVATNDIKEIILPQLKWLSLIKLPSLTNFGPMDYHFILKLNSLDIWNCRKYQMYGEDLDCHGLVIVIHGLERELRSPEGAEGLCKGLTNNLSPYHTFALFISKCDGLQHILSSNLARGLSQLKELYIRDCKELEQIIDEEDHIETPFFPNLSQIDVRGCNKLKHLFPVTIAAGLQQLKSIHVEGCHQLQRVFEHKNGANDMNDKEIVLPQLERLSFIELPNLTSFGPVGYHFPMQLEHLSMEGCNEQMWKIYLGDDVEDFSVDSFKVRRGRYEGDHVSVTFPLDDGGCEFTIKSGVKESDLRCVGDRICLGLWRGLTRTFTLLNLFELRIQECHKMRHIFSSNLARNLLQLKWLYISNCEELEQIVVGDDEDDHIQIPFFPNLWNIEISGCNKLKYVFPIAMVRVGLQELGRIVVKECDELEEVFVDGDRHGDDKEVVLSQLYGLELEKLRKLTNFCSTRYHCILPSLKRLEVKECPKMATRFSYESENRSVHAEDKAPNQGGNNDDEPTMDIYCCYDLEKKLPPFMAEMTSKGSPGKKEQNAKQT